MDTNGHELGDSRKEMETSRWEMKGGLVAQAVKIDGRQRWRAAWRDRLGRTPLLPRTASQRLAPRATPIPFRHIRLIIRAYSCSFVVFMPSLRLSP